MRKLKKLILIFLFSLLVFPLIASPGGDGGGRGSGGHGSPSGSPGGGPGSSGSHGRPTGHGVPSGGPESPSAPGGNPGRVPSAPPPGGFGASPSGGSSNSSSSSSSSSSVPHQNVFNYRGSRTTSTNDEFYLKSLKSRVESDDSVMLEIRFNQNVNPRSFKNDSILIDGEAVPEDTKFSFNRKGDTLRLSVPQVEQYFSLEIHEVESFDGRKIKPIELKNIKRGTTIKS